MFSLLTYKISLISATEHNMYLYISHGNNTGTVRLVMNSHRASMLNMPGLPMEASVSQLPYFPT